MTRIVRLCGPLLSLLLAASIPIGFLQGLNEVLFGFALLAFLGSVQLVKDVVVPDTFSFLTSHPVFFLVLAGFLRWTLLFLSNFVSHLGYEGFSAKVRGRCAGVLDLPMSRLPASVSELSHVLSNLQPKSSNYVSGIVQAATSMLLIVVTLAAAFRLSASLAGVALVATVVFGAPMFFSRRMYQRFSSLIYEETRRFTARMLKNLRNLAFLKLIGRTLAESKALRSSNETIFKAYLRYDFWMILNATWSTFGAVCVIVMIVLAQGREGGVSASILIPFVYLFSRVAAAGGDFMRSVGNIQFHRPFAKALTDFFERLDEASSEGASTGRHMLDGRLSSLEVKNLSVGRDSDLVTGISLSAAPGDVIAVSGESGKGKTTLLLTMIGLVAPRAGEVKWNGIHLKDLDPAEFRKRVAYSGSDPFLLDATVRENLLFGNESRVIPESEIWDALKLAQADFVHTLPGQLEHVLQEAGEGISAGQKQRLSLARALLRRPEVLFLDEATANVDIDTERQIFNAVRALRPAPIVLAVSHRPTVADYATRNLSV